MKARYVLFPGLFIVVLFSLGILLSLSGANSAPDRQFVTATPGPDGRILYTVVAGDSCLQVAFLHGITVPQLRQVNTRLDEICTLTVGQHLIVWLVSSNIATAGRIATLPSPTLTATPVSGTTEVCDLLFDDSNGDALR